jgi:hypothetical protein
MSPANGALGPRWFRLGVLVVSLSVLTGCASTFPGWKPDRCHRAERVRETLNWDIFCFQTP